jgi:hypothetical protein
MIIAADYLVSKLKTLKKDFVESITPNVAKPKKKFINQSLSAVLLSGSLVVMNFASWIVDDCSDKFYRIKRLLNHIINKNGWSDIAQNHRRFFSGFIAPDATIIIDMTDIAKPRARKMEYIDLVRDGSEGKLVTGYWCLEVYANIKKTVVPLVLHPYGINDPEVKSENKQIQEVIEAVNSDINGKGIWLADRGFDRLNIFKSLFSLKIHFIIRQKGNRHIVIGDNTHISVEHALERLYQLQAVNGNNSRIVFTKVRLPERTEQLYLIGRFDQKYDRPLMFLTNMKVLDMNTAKQIIARYTERWKCEEAIEFLKMRIGFERFRIRRYQAIQNICILAMVAMGFLAMIMLSNRVIAGMLFKCCSKFRRIAVFEYYRLLDGLQEFTHKLMINNRSSPILI